MFQITLIRVETRVAIRLIAPEGSSTVKEDLLVQLIQRKEGRLKIHLQLETYQWKGQTVI